MNDDLMKRAHQALQNIDARGVRRSSPPTQVEGADLLARAEAAIAGSVKRPAAPTASQAERVKLPVTCSATGNSYVVIAERRGDVLRFVDHEVPGAAGGAGGARMPRHLSGQYRVESNGWACPLCANNEGVWVCNCERMDGAIHCLGTSGGRSHCACGRFEEHEFVSVESAAVRGTSAAAKPALRNSETYASRHHPRLKQVSHG